MLNRIKCFRQLGIYKLNFFLNQFPALVFKPLNSTIIVVIKIFNIKDVQSVNSSVPSAKYYTIIAAWCNMSKF